MTWNCFTCHFGNTVDETDTEIIAPKVDSGEETPSAARAGTRNRDLSITSPFHCPPRFHFNLDRLSLVTACPVDVLLSTSFAALSVAGLPLFLPHFSFQCQPPVVIHSLGLVRCYHGWIYTKSRCYSPSWSCPLLPLMGLHAPWLLPSWVRCGFFFQR